jgi:tetratricopeptide (TPR) repeat protein
MYPAVNPKAPAIVSAALFIVCRLCAPASAIALQSPRLTGPQLVGQGRLEEALAEFQQGVAVAPKSVAANNGAGVVLDLMGRYAEAQTYFTQAIRVAAKPLDRALAQRAMAIARGFAGDCKGAEKYENDAFDFYLATQDFVNAGEVADEMGRLCLDAGDLNRAYDWYEKGHDAGLQEPNLSPERRDLWDFRWAHARARIAVRRGKADQARKLVMEARAILNKGRIPEQEEYFPYLAGYVEFYAGDYPSALADLNRSNTADPFIRCLLGQTYEKLGDRDHALEFYRKAAGTTAHSVPAAYAQPFAKRKLAELPATATQ